MDSSAVEHLRVPVLTGKAAVAATGALVALLFMSSTLVTPLYVLYEDAFHFSRITQTLVYASYVIGNVTALLVFGRFSDVIGRRRIALAAIAVAILSALLFLFATNTAWLFWARGISGFAVGLGAGTTTAWITELDRDGDKKRASLIATSTNFFGLTVGAVLAGALSQYAPWPLHLCFIVYLAFLVLVALLIARTEETVTPSVSSLGEISLRPRLGIPKSIRGKFIAPAITAFNAMALVGFYAALIPNVLAESLQQKNHALAGAIVGELTLIVALAIVLTYRVKGYTAMLWGLGLLLPGVVLMVWAQASASLSILLIGTLVSGVATALSYRGSLQVVNEIAPADQRAEVVSTYFVTGFVGNSLPVVGVGAVESLATPLIASTSFACMIAIFAVVGLIVGAKYAPAARR
jgi:MFS family permease